MTMAGSNDESGVCTAASAACGMDISITRISTNTADMSSIGISTMNTFISGLSSRSLLIECRVERCRRGRVMESLGSAPRHAGPHRHRTDRLLSLDGHHVRAAQVGSPHSERLIQANAHLVHLL